MKQQQIQIGGVYSAKVGARSVEVRIDRELAKGGWDATSLATNKKIRIKNATKLTPAKVAEVEEVAPAEQNPVDAPAAEAVPEAAPEPPVRPAGAKKGKPAKTPKPPAADKTKAMGCLDAAAAVLKAAGTPMRCKDMITAMAQQGLWSSTAATPEATLYSAILREITTKGDASRFRKTERGHFALKE